MVDSTGALDNPLEYEALRDGLKPLRRPPRLVVQTHSCLGRVCGSRPGALDFRTPSACGGQVSAPAAGGCETRRRLQMSHAVVAKPMKSATLDHAAPSRSADYRVAASTRRQGVAGILAMMTFPGRIRAYENDEPLRGESSMSPPLGNLSGCRCSIASSSGSRGTSPTSTRGRLETPAGDYAPAGLPFLGRGSLDVGQQGHRVLAQRGP
jgi:hypothetical protein